MLEQDTKKFSDLYIFHEHLANRYLKADDLKHSEAEARLAYEKSFAMNRVDIALLLAKILKKEGSKKQTEEAARICRETLKGVSAADYSKPYQVEKIAQLRKEAQ